GVQPVTFRRSSLCLTTTSSRFTSGVRLLSPSTRSVTVIRTGVVVEGVLSRAQPEINPIQTIVKIISNVVVVQDLIKLSRIFVSSKLKSRSNSFPFVRLGRSI